MAHRVSIIGNPAFDLIELPGQKPKRVLSGFVFNTAMILTRLCTKTNVIAKVGKHYAKDFYKKLTNHGIHVSNLITGDASTGFHVMYDKEGNRTLHALGDAGSIYKSDIPKEFFESDAVLIGPLLQEIPLETLHYLATNSSFSLLDPQGLLRRINENGMVESVTIKDAKPFLQNIDILKLTGEEALLMSNSKYMKKALEILSKTGIKIVIITLAERGSIVYDDGKICRIPAYPTNLKDPTGAGDVYAAGFIYEYLKTNDALTSAYFASAAASFMVENVGMDYEINEVMIRERVEKLMEIM